MKTSDASHVRPVGGWRRAGLVLFACLFTGGWNSAIDATAVEQAATKAPAYPAARRTDTTDIFHGVAVADPYRWMEDLGSPELDLWIQAQNRVSAPRLSGDLAFSAIRARLERLDGLNPDRAPGRERGSRTFYLTWVGNAAQLMVQERGATAPPQAARTAGAAITKLVRN